MKKLFACLTILFAITFLSAATASASGKAQAGSGDQATEKKAAPKKGAGGAMLTGCLSGPNDEGAYELKSGKKEVEVGGLDDLSKHVGHKVRLHGAWAKSGAEIGEKENEASEAKEGRERKASATSRSHLSTTSVTLVRPAPVKKLSTRKAPAQALRPSSKNSPILEEAQLYWLR
jgi:hypothetical protein